MKAIWSIGPALLFGLRLWASACLALYVAFWLELDNPSWAGWTAASMCQPHLGASLRKGWHRMIGTVVGAVAIVVLTACVSQHRTAFLVGLALWSAACTLVATLLHNFAAYAAGLAGYTAVIIASDELGATGGPNGEVFTFAIVRASEICLGIVCAGIVLAATDLGGARRRLSTLLAALSAEIMGRFASTLALARPGPLERQPARRELIRQVIALGPVIDEAMGESAQLRSHSLALQTAIDGLFAALAGWRAVAVRLARLPGDKARQEANAILQSIPQELRSGPEHDEPTRWIANPIRLRQVCEGTVRTLIAMPAGTPSLRLLADQTARVLAGVLRALDGVALLVADPTCPLPRGRDVRLRLPDWLPCIVNAGRVFITISAVEFFWIMTAWSNGALAITFTAIVLIQLTPIADQAYATAMRSMVGLGLGAASTAIFKFVVLPGLSTFAGFSIAMGLYLVPVSAMMAQPWQRPIFYPMVAIFVPLLAPTNQMGYDLREFYDIALAIVAGCGTAILSFRLLPPLSPALRTRRILALTLHDLRRLAKGSLRRTTEDWESHMYGRLSALPDEADPLQRIQLVAALAAGTEIIRLRRILPRLGLGSDLDTALEALMQANSAIATAQLARLDNLLASRSSAGPGMSLVLQARASILVVSEALTEHAPYFNTGTS